MTAQLLTSELSTLVQESKRKNPDLRAAAEKSLNDLKSLPRTSEAQIAADLKSRSGFVKPFLLACGTRNPKFAGSGIVGLQRLVVSNALPKETLTEVLEAFRECSTLALDIQLKVLQALPSLLQNYAASLTGKLLVNVFQVCFLLYSSKTVVVSNTAAAALQQLVNSIFEKAALDDDGQSTDVPAVKVPIGDGTVSIYGAALDAHHVLDDICLLTDGQKPEFLVTASLAQNFGLELIESVLANHADTVMAHPEQIHVLRQRLMPLIIKILSERASFSTTVRTMRLLQLVLSRLLFALAEECEMALSLLNHMLDADAATLWKRALCLEVFRNIHSEPALVRSIYAHYDQADEKRNIVRDHLGSLVRLASEKPAIIGLGQQSSIPSSVGPDDTSGEQAAVQAGGLVGSIGASVTVTDTNRSGISTQWSMIRTPCIEQLDKSEPPNLPATYIYSLALTCITRFSEGLARFLLPFTVPVETKSKRKQSIMKETGGRDNIDGSTGKTLQRYQPFGGRRPPVNPLSLKEHVLYGQITTSGHMVDHCWPALLAASSTYLNATLDSENYHALIRSFQKFTQIAGLLDLATPRDAFLTTLGKHAVPAMNSTSITPHTNGRDPGLREEFTDSDRESSPVPSIRGQSTDLAMPTMNTRHLLCLRALLNLGIALGPVLKKSWTIILETLLQADLILSVSGPAGRKQTKRLTSKAESDAAAERADGAEDLGLEVTAAETAASRLFKSTADLPSGAFLDLVKCICLLLHVEMPMQESRDGLLSPKPAAKRHQKVRSVSGVPMEGGALGQSNGFVLDKLDDVIHSNIARMQRPETSENGWNYLLEVLTGVLSSNKAQPEVRVKAAHALNGLIASVAVSDEPLLPKERDAVWDRSLYALQNQVSALYEFRSQGTTSSRSCEIEIHRMALEALKSILEHCGDSLDTGWKSVLAMIKSIFDESTSTGVQSDNMPSPRSNLPQLVRTAFGSLQLICSDFLASVPSSHLLTLLDTLYYYCAQNLDLNISLTTATLFRNASDFLQRDGESIDFEFLESQHPSNMDLTRWAPAEDVKNSTMAMWLYLLHRLMLFSMDRRLEVRHSALHTLFRIFDASSDQLTVSALQVCFNTVLIKILEANAEQHLASEGPEASSTKEDVTQGWNETAIIEVEGIANLFSQWLDTHKGNRLVIAMCEDLFERYTLFLKRHVLNVSNTVFTGVTKILAEVENSESADKSLLNKAWELWKDANPASHADSSKRRTGNQDALTAYLHCLRELLRLFAQELRLEQTQTILKELRVCVVESTATAYSVDVDHLTPVQGMVLEGIKSIPSNTPEIIPELVQSINGLATLAYEQESDPLGKKQTYMALSKAAMSLLDSCIISHIRSPGLDLIGIVSEAVNALAIPIHLKYRWKPEGKDPSPWSKATTTVLSILEACMPAIQASHCAKQDNPQLWERIVKTSDGIVAANYDACTNLADIPKDQESNIEFFSRIRKLVIPTLGSPSIPDTVRRKYAESIFRNSIIHEPHPDDLARPGQELLEGLRSTHIGRVNDLPPSPRSKMCYLLLDELVSLVAVHDGSPERTRLAQAAAPYLILRAGLTLKAYVMDHPLRGRMPQPWSQKKEMLYILRKLTELDSEPKAIPAAPGITSEHKKHLHRLYPLVLRALKAAWRDEEMSSALQEVLDAVGDDFGI